MRDVQRHLLCIAVIVVVGLLVYVNSFHGVFVFDDIDEIVRNEKIRSFEGLWGNRPLVHASLALNYAMGGLQPWGYHAVNLIVHLLAGLTLYGIVRRTLTLERFAGVWLEGAATWAALAVAIFWVVHPLQTESVTYVIQRAESMMGLLYLFTIYAMLRASTSTMRPWPWYAAAIVSCALGMLSKPVMITAPMVALLFDAAIVTGSLSRTLRARWVLYAGLAATWTFLILNGTTGMIFDTDPTPGRTAGYGFQGWTPLEYALTQPGVIIHYVRLAIWPDPLVLDYGWPIAKTASEFLLPLILVGLVGVLALLSLRRWAWAGCLVISFFLILSPTSSIVPFGDAAVEHRMYLPLAALIALSVVAGHRLIGLLCARLSVPAAATPWINGALVAVIAGSLGARTVQRNRDFHSEYGMWEQVVDQRPLNGRAYNQLGVILAERDQLQAAIAHYQHAVRLNPMDHLSLSNLGNALVRVSRHEDAIIVCERAIEVRPTYVPARNNYGTALVAVGRMDEGVAQFSEALTLDPGDPWAHRNMGRALAVRSGISGGAGGDTLAIDDGLVESSIEHLVEALRIKPDFPDAVNCLALVVFLDGEIDETMRRYDDRRGHLRPAHVLAHILAGEQQVREGRTEDALAHYRRALEIDPQSADARQRLAAVSMGAGVIGE